MYIDEVTNKPFKNQIKLRNNVELPVWEQLPLIQIWDRQI
jgi:hypothetical protein